MKLTRVTLSGFTSIKGTENLLIDKGFTVLIGANDHGKTNLLKSILRLNDDKPILEIDRNWDLISDKQPKIEWYFTISDNELDDFNEDVIQNKITGTMETPEDTAEIPLEKTKTQYFDVNTSQEMAYFKEGINTPLKVLSTPFQIPIEKEKELLKIRPKVEGFFDPITTNLKDQATLPQLKTPQFEVMQGIFHLAGLWENKDILFTQNDRTAKLLDEASEKLTYILNDKWNQGSNLEWKLSHTGNNGDQIIIQIKDPSINSQFSRPSLRSSGFQTYFVLSMMINARKYNNPDNTFIFLFDEPGTYLHPYAQIDLQRSFEAVAEKTQIIYATHSIFLINKNHPKRNRVVSKTKDGTKIDQKPFQKNWKSVRESLGILLSNNFLIAEKTLLVEGPSDIIYILDAIKRLKKANKVDIDLNDICIVDAGNSENYVAMAKLMLSEGREIVALVDGDDSGNKIIENLRKVCEKEYKDKRIKIHQLPNNKSIEDVLCKIDELRNTIEKFTNELINIKVRVIAQDIDLSKELEKIRSNKNKTLGFTIKELTKQWFQPPDGLSKLSIALVYEDIVENKDFDVSEEALNLVMTIRDLMQLKGEKSADKGVFEEIKY